MSTVSPIETKWLNPTFCLTAQSRTEVQRAPLWEMNAVRPGSGIFVAKLTLRCAAGRMKPRQLGPSTRMSYLRDNPRMLSYIPSPCFPASLNPAETITRLRTPATPHSSTRSGTVAAGVAMTPRSIRSGILSMEGYASTPWTLRRLEFTG